MLAGAASEGGGKVSGDNTAGRAGGDTMGALSRRARPAWGAAQDIAPEVAPAAQYWDAGVGVVRRPHAGLHHTRRLGGMQQCPLLRAAVGFAAFVFARLCVCVRGWLCLLCWLRGLTNTSMHANASDQVTNAHEQRS